MYNCKLIKQDNMKKLFIKKTNTSIPAQLAETMGKNQNTYGINKVLKKCQHFNTATITDTSINDVTRK